MKGLFDSGNNLIDFEPAFKCLNKKLLNIGQSLKLICVGGYVMQLHGYRGTADIDAFFDSNPIIENAIRKVGDKFKINGPDELWLNNSVTSKNPLPPPKHQEMIYEFSNLIVMSVDITYLMGMKLYSGRTQDLQDVATIIKNNSDKQPLKLFSNLVDIGFTLDISIVLDVFEQAYGIAWLEQFYLDNESLIKDLY